MEIIIQTIAYFIGVFVGMGIMGAIWTIQLHADRAIQSARDDWHPWKEGR